MPGVPSSSLRNQGTASEVRLVHALLGLAAWAVAVPWLARALGLELDVSTRLEVIDHVVPGVLILACGAAILARPGGTAPGSLPWLLASATASLAGLWIVITHVPLLPQVVDGGAPWGAALMHLSAGLPIVVAMWMLLLPERPR